MIISRGSLVCAILISMAELGLEVPLVSLRAAISEVNTFSMRETIPALIRAGLVREVEPSRTLTVKSKLELTEEGRAIATRLRNLARLPRRQA